MKTGIELITEERNEQLSKHGRTVDDDVRHNTEHQLSFAALMLAHPLADVIDYDPPKKWNKGIFAKMKDKPYKDRLIIAGALIAAEIDRLQSIEP